MLWVVVCCIHFIELILLRLGYNLQKKKKISHNQKNHSQTPSIKRTTYKVRSNLPSPHNARNRDINPSRIRRRIAQQINIGTAQLLRQGQSRHPTIILHLGLPVRTRLHIVSKRRLHKPRRDTINPNPVLRPLHRKRMRHIAHGGLGPTIRGARGRAVRAITGHTRREDNGALDAELDESVCGGGGAVPRAKDIQLEEALDLVEAEVEGGLVLCCAGVGDHAVEAALFGDDLVEGSLDAGFGGDVGLDEGEAFGVLGCEVVEGVAGGGDVEGVDVGGAVGETDFGEPEADSLVCAGDC